MFVIVIILGFVAVAMAKTTPNMDGQAVPPNTLVPSLGATDKFSPALTGGSDLVAKDNRVRLGMVYQNAPSLVDQQRLSPMPRGTVVGIRGGLTDAQASLKTQDVPPTVLTTELYNPTMFRNRMKL